MIPAQSEGAIAICLVLLNPPFLPLDRHKQLQGWILKPHHMLSLNYLANAVKLSSYDVARDTYIRVYKPPPGRLGCPKYIANGQINSSKIQQNPASFFLHLFIFPPALQETQKSTFKGKIREVREQGSNLT